MGTEVAWEWLFRVALILLALGLFSSLLRCIRGPRIADRIMAVNMAGTQIVMMIAILAVMKGEGYLTDVALIYAMLSLLATVLLTKVYLGVYRERKIREKKEESARG